MEAALIVAQIYGLVVTIALIVRLGYTTPAMLLIFVLVANLVALGVFAFRRSPLQTEVEELRQQIRDLTAAVQQHAPAAPVPVEPAPLAPPPRPRSSSALPSYPLFDSP